MVVHKYNVEMPIVEEAYNILYNGRNARGGIIAYDARKEKK